MRAQLGVLISAETLASSRSFEIERELGNEAWGLALLYVTITDTDNSETGVSVDCTASEDDNTTPFRVPACVWDGTNTRYNCEAGPLFWNPTDETTPKKQVFRVDVEGFVDLECTMTFTGGSASDTISTTVTLATKD